jgi:hypothetical protein
MPQQPNTVFSATVAAPEITRSRQTDGTSNQSEFAALVSEALRRGITAKFFATLGADGQLRGDLRTVCLEAKRQGLRVEHLIVAFKDAWRTLPEARLLPQGTQGPEFLNRVITLCIAEFYAPRAD